METTSIRTEHYCVFGFLKKFKALFFDTGARLCANPEVLRTVLDSLLVLLDSSSLVGGR